MESNLMQREIRLGEEWSTSLRVAAGKALKIGAFAGMTALGASIYIPLPFTPVPLTLQTFSVLLSGAFLGGAGGALSQGVYLLLGSLGAPVWGGGWAGLSRLWGPTGGYLLAFPLAAWAVGLALEGEARPGWLKTWGALLLGTLMIYVPGLFHLCLGYHWDLEKAMLLGLLPFLPGDLLKVGVAGWICRRGIPIRFSGSWGEER